MGEAKELTKKKAFKMPHTLVIIFMIIFAAVLFTWVVPSGAYVRFEDAVTGRNLIDPESFHYVENTPVNPLKIMNYVIDGFMDAADLIFMLMFAGGAFHLITESGALQASIAKVARKFSNRFYIFIPMLTLIFTLIATNQGVNLFIPFVPITVMLSFALGLDSLVGVSIILLGGAVGFSTGTLQTSTTLLAQEIVDQILPFSRRETDSSQYNVVNLNAVIWDALKMVRMLLTSSVRLVVKPYNGPINVYGSATQIHQILLNLCTNACQAMEPAGGTLTVATRRISQDQLPQQFHPVSEGEFVQIEVSDTGCGIPSEMLSQIFDPFFTTKAAGDGTGLGLSVVQNILISHGGFIEAKSTLGQGSRFLVYLPITNQLPNVSIQEGKKSGRTGMGSILLVDDELRVVRYFKRRLLHLGYQVDAFTDPEEALNTFKRTPEHWDLLIVDEAMPKLRGTALLQYMKQHNHDLRVILVTGLVGDSAIRLHAERQIDEILTKPVEFEALSGTIVRLLSEETSDK